MLFEAATGRIKNTSVIHKFGRNSAIGTTFVPVAAGGVYQTPKGSAATALRIAAGGDANDTSNGSGARQVTVQGLDENGMFASEVITTNGVSASTATTTTFMRLYRAYVSASGTYATQSAGSHADTITIENSAGGTTWGVIDATSFPKAQTEIGVYSIADGYKGYVTSFFTSSDSTKTTDFILFKREEILLESAPFQGMRAQFVGQSTGDNTVLITQSPIGPFNGPCDLGFLAKVDVGTASVSVDFEIVLEKC